MSLRIIDVEEEGVLARLGGSLFSPSHICIDEEGEYLNFIMSYSAL